MDGSIPAYATPQHGHSVNFYADLGRPKYLVRATLPVFGFFFDYTLDKVVCPHLAVIMIFGMPIWHPTNEGYVHTLLPAQLHIAALFE
jgi:hypothetical protein